jgi:very-short-patch-repair endonuclease
VARLSFDEAIGRLAMGQHGVVARRQLIALGITPSAIRHRLATRRLRIVHATVYAVGHSLLLLNARYMAAVLACGDQAVLSHRDAATLLGLFPVGSGAIEVTTPRLGIKRIRGIAVHRSRSLPVAETTTREGIPCTTVARTLVDLAGCEPPRRLRRALEQSLVLGLFDLQAMNVALDRAKGRRGAGTLRRLLAETHGEPPITRKELERRFLELVRSARLPQPVANGLLQGHEVDFHWPAQRLVVETDGRATHAHALAFHEDRRRDLDLELAGWHVLRVTWRHVVHEPERVTVLLRSRLESTAAQPCPSGPATVSRHPL